MGEVGAYLSTVEGADRDALQRVYAIAREVVPEAEEGTSYAMPALLYRDKGLIAKRSPSRKPASSASRSSRSSTPTAIPPWSTT